MESSEDRGHEFISGQTCSRKRPRYASIVLKKHFSITLRTLIKLQLLEGQYSHLLGVQHPSRHGSLENNEGLRADVALLISFADIEGTALDYENKVNRP